MRSPKIDDVSNAGCEEMKPHDFNLGFLLPVSTEIPENESLETIKPLVRSCVETLKTYSASSDSKRTAAANLRLLAKHRSDFRLLIGKSGAIQTLIPLLHSTDPITQENAVTALLNLSLEESNKAPIALAIEPLIHALHAGTTTSKQNAACALLNLSTMEENRIEIGARGAIPPLVSLLVSGTRRGKKDALTALYRLCGGENNRAEAVRAGAVTPLVALMAEGRDGTTEKEMVVLSRLAEIEEGREAIVEEGGIPALLEAVEFGIGKWKEFAVVTMLLICRDSEINRGMIVREGGVPAIVKLSQSSSSRTKHKVSLPPIYIYRVIVEE